jgi:hypothetical protein
LPIFEPFKGSELFLSSICPELWQSPFLLSRQFVRRGFIGNAGFPHLNEKIVVDGLDRNKLSIVVDDHLLDPFEFILFHQKSEGLTWL